MVLHIDLINQPYNMQSIAATLSQIVSETNEAKFQPSMAGSSAVMSTAGTIYLSPGVRLRLSRLYFSVNVRSDFGLSSPTDDRQA